MTARCNSKASRRKAQSKQKEGAKHQQHTAAKRLMGTYWKLASIVRTPEYQCANSMA